ncbi:MAG: FlgO family outer membrane protein [Campylobacterota bacterium]|nr:FlgO family outer membrane protein [Campylobacterota bacterium]
MYKLNNLILPIILVFFTACSIPQYSNQFEFQTTDYDEIVEDLLDKASNQIFPHIKKDEVLLVSNFAESSTLKSNTKLSFVLSDMLKDKIVSKYSYTIREIELSKQFKFGKEGFKALTRDIDNINSEIIDARYAVVGTYTFTKTQILLFLKLIDIRNGYVLASSSYSTRSSMEMVELNSIIIDNKDKPTKNAVPHIYQPMVL